MNVLHPLSHDWVNLRAQSHPDVIALEFFDRKKFTYAEFDIAISKVSYALNENISEFCRKI